MVSPLPTRAKLESRKGVAPPTVLLHYNFYNVIHFCPDALFKIVTNHLFLSPSYLYICNMNADYSYSSCTLITSLK